MLRKNFTIPLENVELEGELTIPPESKSLVIFSHGSGSSRFSPRNNFVAEELHKRNISTYLFDLLTNEEDQVYANRFNIDVLTERLVSATIYIGSKLEYADFKIGYFGASTGAASAIRAAVSLPETILAIVSRGGRPDLALEVVHRVKAPTLLIVGEIDYDVLEMNKAFYKSLSSPKKLHIVPNATHLFEEKGTLEEVAIIAADWFEEYLK